MSLFYSRRYQRYCLNPNSSKDYHPRQTREFSTLNDVLNYLVREEGRRKSVLSLDEQCSQEIPEKRYETRPDPEEGIDKLYLRGTKIEVK